MYFCIILVSPSYYINASNLLQIKSEIDILGNKIETFTLVSTLNQRVRNDGVVSQIFLLTQSLFEMSPPRLWELQS